MIQGHSRTFAHPPHGERSRGCIGDFARSYRLVTLDFVSERLGCATYQTERSLGDELTEVRRGVCDRLRSGGWCGDRLCFWSASCSDYDESRDCDRRMGMPHLASPEP